ncbi:MAG: SGNH/GDSL hydrolase family protein [Microthrixaceae bacterium]|nr:SGNH/GDSL hydrolase family protein [Microthrixaceae bacterium]
MRGRHLAALVALLWVAVPSCVDAGERVAVLGDSITALDAGALEEDLGDDYRFSISGTPGATADQVLPEAQELAQRSFDQVIINLGTNDVLQWGSPEQAVAAIAQYVVMFDSARCVHVVTVNENMQNQLDGRSTSDGARELNDALRAFAETQDHVTVIDWNAAAEQSLNGAEPPSSTLTSDSIHPTPEGNQVLNGLYGDALGGCARAF